jgi:alpha-N-acetylglucosaminidase (NAGLU)-like protein
LVTYWGPDDPTTELHDYANKEWSGLLRDFYQPRWEMFVRNLSAQLDGKPAPEPDYFAFEKQWTEQRLEYSVRLAEHPVTTANLIFTKMTTTGSELRPAVSAK